MKNRSEYRTGAERSRSPPFLMQLFGHIFQTAVGRCLEQGYLEATLQLYVAAECEQEVLMHGKMGRAGQMHLFNW